MQVNVVQLRYNNLHEYRCMEGKFALSFLFKNMSPNKYYCPFRNAGRKGALLFRPHVHPLNHGKFDLIIFPCAASYIHLTRAD